MSLKYFLTELNIWILNEVLKFGHANIYFRRVLFSVADWYLSFSSMLLIFLYVSLNVGT